MRSLLQVRLGLMTLDSRVCFVVTVAEGSTRNVHVESFVFIFDMGKRLNYTCDVHVDCFICGVNDFFSIKISFETLNTF